jgi:hypothetical protein
VMVHGIGSAMMMVVPDVSIQLRRQFQFLTHGDKK